MAGFCSEKLVHPLPEVRRRALQSLDFKVKHALLSQQDFLQDRAILSNLLGLLKFDSNGAQVDASALLLLQRVASSFPLAARQLLQLGTEDSLRLLRPKRSPDLHALIDSALSQLAPMAPGDGPLFPGGVAQDTQNGRCGSSNKAGSALAYEMGYHSGPQAGHATGTPLQHFGSTVLLPPHTISRPLEPEFRSAATPYDPPHPHMLSVTPALPPSPPNTVTPTGTSLSSEQPWHTPPYSHSHHASSLHPTPHHPQHPFLVTPGSNFPAMPSVSADLSADLIAAPSITANGVMDTAHVPGSMSVRGQWGSGSLSAHRRWGSGIGSGWAEAVHPTPSRASGRRPSLPGALVPTPGSLDVVHRHHHHHHHQQQQLQQQRERQQQILQQYYSPQKQLLQLECPGDVQAVVRRLRAERGADGYAGGVAPMGSSLPPQPTDWLLPAVPLGASDEQHLFELVLRLKCMQEPDRIVAPALQELLGGAAADFPPEALVSVPGLVDQLLFILTSTPHDSSLQPPAAALLLHLVEGLKASIARATDPMLLCPGSQSKGTMCALAAAAVGTTVQNGIVGSSPLKPKAPLSASSPAKVQAAGAEMAAQQQQQQLLPRGPSVPAPLLTIPDSVPPHPEALQRFITAQHALNVSALAYDLALTLLPHLANPLRHSQLLPLLESLAPLLLVSTDGPISLQHQQQLLQADNVFLQPGEGWEGGVLGLKGSPGRQPPSGASKGAKTGAGAGQGEALGWGGGAAEAAAFVKWHSLMQAAAAALVPCLAMARAESPAVVQVYQGDPSIVAPPIINIPSATLVVLITRLLHALPASLVQPQLVPPAISDTMAAIARDDVLCAALPPCWRPAALAILSKLRPDVDEVLEVADEADQAVQTAQQLVYQLPHLLSGTIAPASWLSLVEMALLALDLAPDTQLLQAIIQGLAFICCADSLEGGEVHAQAEAVLLGLLQHPLPGVQLAVYALMEQMVMEVRGHKDHPLLSLMCRHNVLAHLTTVGLAQPSTRPQVAHVLQELLVRGNTQHNKNLLHWHCWVCTNDDDPQAGVLASSLSSLRLSSGHALPENAWERAALAVMGLLSRRPETRQGSARDLRDLLHLVHGVLVPAGEPHTGDPLNAVLDNGARDDLLLPTASGSAAAPADASDPAHGTPSTSAYPTSLLLQGGPGAAARLARNWTPHHAENLLSILANPALAPELRRSAAEQLLGLTAEPRLLAEICQPHHLAAMLGTLAPHACSPANGAATTTALLTSLDVQLPVAAANLLYACACASSAARAWLLEQSSISGTKDFNTSASLQSHGPTTANDTWIGRSSQQQQQQGHSGAHDSLGSHGTGERGMGGLRGALPLLFHSLLTVRRAVARLLAAVLLQGEADKWEGWGRLVASADRETKTGILHLPRPFASAFALPCKVTWLEVKVPPMGTKDRQGNNLSDMPKLQGLVAEQGLIVAQIVEERRLLSSAGGSLSGVLQLLNEPPQGHAGMPQAAAAAWQLPPAAAQACAANITALSLCSQVASALERVRSATSHAECGMALGYLQLLAATRQGAAALALCDWQGALDTLLTSSPATLEDHALWCMLLPLVRRVLTAGVLTPPQLLHVALCLQQSVLPLLEEPNVAMAPVPMPVALAGSPVAEQEADSDTGHRLQVVTTAQHVLRTLCALLRCSRTHHSVHTTLRIAQALSLPRLLHVLCTGFVRASEFASYGCRVLAVGVIGEVLAVLKRGQLGEDGAESLTNAPGMEDVLLLCLTSLLTEVAHSRHTAAPTRFVQQAASQGGTAAAAGVAAAVAAGFRGKGLVHASMPCLVHLTRLLPMVQWSVVWQQSSGIFWLSRVARDRDARLRASAYRLLACLLRPGAYHTHRMLAHAWPDVASRALQVLFGRGASMGGVGEGRAGAEGEGSEPPAVKAELLRLLTCVLALPPQSVFPAGSEFDLDPLPLSPAARSLVPLSPEALLRHMHVWGQGLTAMVCSRGTPPGLLAPALALLLQGLIVDVEAFGAHVRGTPGFLNRLQRLCTPEGQQLLLENAREWAGGPGEDPCSAPGLLALLSGSANTGSTAPAPADPAAAAAGALSPFDGQCSASGAAAAALCLEQISEGGLGSLEAEVSLNLEGAWAGEGQASHTGTRHAGVQQGAGKGHRASKAEESSHLGSGRSRFGMKEGLMVRPHPDANGAGILTLPEHGHGQHQHRRQQQQGHLLHLLHGGRRALAPTQQQEALRCSQAAAQVLGLLVMEPSLFDLERMGLSVRGIAAEAACALLYHGAHLSQIDKAVSSATASRLALYKAILGAVHELLVLCANATHLLSENQVMGLLKEVEQAVPSVSLAEVLAELQACSCAPKPTRLMGACFVATLLAHASTAQALLTNKTTGQEYTCEASGQPVGATLCLALIAAIPPEALAVPHSSDTGAPLGSDHQLLDGDTLVCVVALRNVVAHSTSAKPAAIGTGLHTALLNCCLGAAQCLETAQRDAAFANGNVPARSRQAPPPPSAASSIGTPVRGGRAIGKIAHQLRTPTRQSAASGTKGDDAGASTAGVQGEASVPLTPNSRQQTAAAAAAAAAGAGAAGSCPLAQSPVFDRKVTVALSLLRHLVMHSAQTKAVLLQAGLIQVLDQLWQHGFVGTSPAPTSSSHHPARGSHTGVAADWVGTGHPCSSGRTSKATSPSERVRASTSHAFSGGPGTKAGGALPGHPAVHSVAKDIKHGAPCSAYPALHEVLGLLTNMVVGFEEAQAAVCGEGCPTLLQRVLGLLFERKLETPTFCLITGLLGHLAAEVDGTACLLRGGATGACSGGPGGEAFLLASQRCVRDLVHALPGPSLAGGAAMRPKDLPRILGLMQVLVNMAAHAEGARALLKGSHTAAGLLEVLLGPEGLLSEVGGLHGQPKQQQGTQALQCAGLLLLRNLSFCGDAKTHLLAHPRVLPVLLAHAECPTEAPKAAAIAASALWTLTYQGEKVKSAVRRLPSALQRLTVARAAAHFHATKLAKASQQQAAQLQTLQAQAAQLQAAHLQEARQHALQLQASALHPSSPPLQPSPTTTTDRPASPGQLALGAAGPAARQHEVPPRLTGASPKIYGTAVAIDPCKQQQQQLDSAAGEQLHWLRQAIEYYDAIQAAMDATSAATKTAAAAGARASPPPPDQGSSMPPVAASAAASAAATTAAEAALGFKTLPGIAGGIYSGVVGKQLHEEEGLMTAKTRGVDRAGLDMVGARDQDKGTQPSGFVPPARKQLGW